MTPGELATYARQQYNAVNDSFFSDVELYTHAWHAQNILAKEKLVENTYTTSTVASQQEYTYPTNAIAIKRITCNGKPLIKISFREDDLMTGFNAATTATGTPTAYAIFDRVIYLRPIPATVVTLKIFSFDNAQEVSANSTLDVPEEFHLDLVNYLLWKMAAKDQNFQSAQYYMEQWNESVKKSKQWARRRATADGFNTVQDTESVYDPLEVF